MRYAAPMLRPTPSLRSRRSALLPATLAALLTAASAQAQPGPTDTAPAPAPEVAVIEDANERADRLHLEAKALLEENKWEEALPKLEEAYALKASFDIVTNLGWTLSALERHVEAARLLHEASEKLPTVLDDESRAIFQNNYTDARARVGIARVSLEPGTQLLVDGEPVVPVGRDKLVFVEPGEHRFEAERDGAKSAPVVRSLAAGKEETIALGPVDPSGPSSANADATSAQIAFGSILGVGIVGVVVGAAVMGAAGSFGSEADTLRQTIAARSGPTPCPGGDPSCAELEDTLEKKDTYFNAGLGVLIGGAALTGLGLVGLAVTFVGDDDTDTTARIIPQLGPDQLGVSVLGRF